MASARRPRSARAPGGDDAALGHQRRRRRGSRAAPPRARRPGRTSAGPGSSRPGRVLLGRVAGHVAEGLELGRRLAVAAEPVQREPVQLADGARSRAPPRPAASGSVGPRGSARPRTRRRRRTGVRPPRRPACCRRGGRARPGRPRGRPSGWSRLPDDVVGLATGGPFVDPAILAPRAAARCGRSGCCEMRMGRPSLVRGGSGRD